MEYCFGDGDHPFYVHAKNADIAVKIFTIEELLPEKYIAENCYTNKKEETWYDDALRESMPKELRDDMYIPMYEVREVKGKRKCILLKNIPLMACINVNYTLITDSKLLPMDETFNETAVVEKSDTTEIRINCTNKIQAREMFIEAKRKRYELEEQRDRLGEQLQALEEDLRNKVKQLAALETYMGIYEDIVQLQKGKNADDKMPISIYQLKLYMDEEVGILGAFHVGYKKKVLEVEDLDFTKIERFDAWIVKHYKEYIPEEKAIEAWEVRRHNKKYVDLLLILI
jgi:hypothetical protein